MIGVIIFFDVICFFFAFWAFYGIVKTIKEIIAVWDSTEGVVRKAEAAEGNDELEKAATFQI